MSTRLATTVGAALWLASACGNSDDAHPPQYSPDAAGVMPRTCDDVRKGEVQGNVVWVAGAIAGCGAPGLVCPVFGIDAFAAVCAKGTPFATCQSGRWVVLCDPDAGVVASDAGDTSDATSDATAADAASE